VHGILVQRRPTNTQIGGRVSHGPDVPMPRRMRAAGEDGQQHRLPQRLRRPHQQQLAGMNPQRDVVEDPNTYGAASGNTR
jgi:hypothetical protein